jgi:hypothetical protein
MHLNDALERADRDIATAREYIEHQKTLIKDLEAYGRDTTRAVKLLDVFSRIAEGNARLSSVDR